MTNPNGRPKREAPPKEELLSLYVRHEGKIDLIRKELGCSWAYAKSWLVDAGIIDNWGQPIEQTPTLEPDELGGENRNEGEGESATDSIPYSVERLENIGRDIQPVKMPIGCSLPLEDSTEPQGEVMAKSDTGEEEAGEYIPWNIAKDYGWPPNNAVEKIMLEEVINAQFAVRRVLNNSVALALMKQVLGSGVV